jgi:hypothetical protein
MTPIIETKMALIHHFILQTKLCKKTDSNTSLKGEASKKITVVQTGEFNLTGTLDGKLQLKEEMSLEFKK